MPPAVPACQGSCFSNILEKKWGQLATILPLGWESHSNINISPLNFILSLNNGFRYGDSGLADFCLSYILKLLLTASRAHQDCPCVLGHSDRHSVHSNMSFLYWGRGAVLSLIPALCMCCLCVEGKGELFPVAWWKLSPGKCSWTGKASPTSPKGSVEEEGLRHSPPFPQTILHNGNTPSPNVDLQEVLLSSPVIDATAVSLTLRGTVNELRGLQSIRMTASQESLLDSPGLGYLGTATDLLSWASVSSGSTLDRGCYWHLHDRVLRLRKAARVQSSTCRWVRRRVPRNSGMPRTRKTRRQAEKSGQLSWHATVTEPKWEPSRAVLSWGESGDSVPLHAIRRVTQRVKWGLRVIAESPPGDWGVES